MLQHSDIKIGEVSTFFIDAGFKDPDYLEEVADEWIIAELDEAVQADMPELAIKIQAKIGAIHEIIPS